jgi:hypothetical protein
VQSARGGSPACNEGGAISMQGGRCNQHAMREVQPACNEGGAASMQNRGRCHSHALNVPSACIQGGSSHIERPHEATPGRARARNLLIRQLHSRARAAPGGSNGPRTDCRCEGRRPCSPLRRRLQERKTRRNSSVGPTRRQMQSAAISRNQPPSTHP